MENSNPILEVIKSTVHKSDPKAKVILYGSFARGDNHKDSDIDLVILLDIEKVTRQDEINIKYPLYDIEFETGQIISPIVYSKKDWEERRLINPFYENVLSEGIVL